MAPTNAAMGTTQVVQVSNSGWKTVMSDETVMTANAATHTQATCSLPWRKPGESHTSGGKDCRAYCRVNGFADQDADQRDGKECEVGHRLRPGGDGGVVREQTHDHEIGRA